MQYVPLHLAQELWNATPESNWSALRERVRERLEKEGAFEDVHPTTLFQIIKRLAHIGAEYPDSPEGLYRVLNEQIREITG
jgi:flagellar biosynthesis/type III secretory pathway protein FliH